MKTFTHSLLLIFMLIFLLSGCWDLQEVEELGFVIGVAIDPVKEEEDKNKFGTGKNRANDELFRMTFQIAVPEALKVSETGNGREKSYVNLTSPGLTDMKISRNIVSRSSRRVNMEHLQVIIMNHELGRKGLIDHLLDLLLRDHEMRRKKPHFYL